VDIFDQYLSPLRFTERTDGLREYLSTMAEKLLGLLETNQDAVESYASSLQGAVKRLTDEAMAGEDLRGLVTSLLTATRLMGAHNQALGAHLVASQTEVRKLQANLDTVRVEAMQDALTLLSNRKAFDLGLARAMTSAKATLEPFSLLVIDIDHFKQFNDTYGHLTGDQVLRLVASALKQRVRASDLVARYGGEEFSVILPNTPLRLAKPVAEQLRQAVMRKELVKKSTGETLGKVTVSIGIATFEEGDTGATIVERADACLYAAKRSGRNRVVSEDEMEQPRIDAVA
jgi:diguanylate cyclase